MEKLPFDVAINEEFVREKKVFVAHCLTYPVSTQGRNIEEAMQNIKEAVALYLEECPEEKVVEKREILPPIATRLFL